MEKSQGGALAESLPQWLDSGKGLVSCVVSHVQTHRAGTESTA